MHYLISGLAKSGTTRLFTQVENALKAQERAPETFFEPWKEPALQAVLATGSDTLTKVLIGRVTADNLSLESFSRHVLIYRDPRDQFLSTLLYLFYDFQVNGDADGYGKAYAALERKVSDPAGVSALELYDELAVLVGRPKRRVFERLHEVQQTFQGRFKPFMLAYEDLIDGRATQTLSTYLDLPLTDEVTVSTDYARVSRSKSYGEWRSWLTAEDQDWVREHWGAHLQALGYSLDAVPDPREISAQLSLDYVAQFRPAR